MSLKSPMKDKILQVERKIVLEKPNEGQNPPDGAKKCLEKPMKDKTGGLPSSIGE
ncbi:hypothetical protein NDK43_30820 [Neobacillus pocheonensis]|uniref:Multidrug transporter n=1 Tax=Neobacillus pocheonensis TaxID=363869 RepID=A0ABT0WHS5_9BACI|nr:hypothetical protein [Neobacillus pocheonensis]